MSRQTSNRIDHRRIWQRSFADVDAATLEDDRAALPRESHEFGREPRLANACLARDDGRAALAVTRQVENGAETTKFGGAPDQDGARYASCHPVDYQADHPRGSFVISSRDRFGLKAAGPHRERSLFPPGRCLICRRGWSDRNGEPDFGSASGA